MEPLVMPDRFTHPEVVLTSAPDFMVVTFWGGSRWLPNEAAAGFWTVSEADGSPGCSIGV